MIENILNDLSGLTKFFGYSSIQAKFISTFVAIVIFVIIRRIIQNNVNRRTEDALFRYRTNKTTTYVLVVLASITIG